MAEFDQIPETALEWAEQDCGAALATVVQTWGSAPRPVGSQLAISGDGQIMGSVSGGCVEGAVVVEAQEAIEDGRPRILEFGVSDDEAFAVGLACGGTIRVMVEPLGIGDGPAPELIRALVDRRKRRQPAALLTNTKTWERRLTDGADIPDDPLGAEIRARMAADRSGFAPAPDDGWFIAIHNAPLRMVVVGAVHIAQALLPMARLAGYDPFLIDPRETFAAAARFPDESISQDWPDEALRALAPDSRTAVVTLSHDPKIDDPAIIETLNSTAFYLGCLGSKKTHAKRLDRLRAVGLDEEALARIHAPVGLSIGAKSPAEIAISIMAEITQTLRGTN
ncbi:MAG: XdhC family protein [Paracoccaceae bacterium]|nr:XdhC family protein [Paracoccaceae bacterium]